MGGGGEREAEYCSRHVVLFSVCWLSGRIGDGSESDLAIQARNCTRVFVELVSHVAAV
jgi:hypothetical protein